MGAHIQITFHSLQPEQQEWAIAHLAEAGYDGFEEKEEELVAYIPEEKFDPLVLKELAYKYQFRYSQSRVEEQNWNEVWESNFHPVIIDDFVGIRADFHPPLKNVTHEIIITPKMSFGTGHHATTAMMIRQLRELDLSGMTVFDFGTGTGILSILAEKLGAAHVLAVDNDNWSIENARENLAKNGCSRVEVSFADSIGEQDVYDLILANINKNVITAHLATLAGHLREKGMLILSGLLTEDAGEISEIATAHRLKKINQRSEGQWLSMRFDKDAEPR